jgi:acyl-CoA synthetase (AMP-forming)/AMP-acid ligase II
VLTTGVDPPRAGDVLPLADDVVLVTSPLFHTSALYGAVLRGAVKGTTVVLLPGRFDAERVLQTIDEERVTSWLALGSAAPRACAVADPARYDTSSLVHIGVGGAPVSPAVQETIRATFPGVKKSLTMGYASTESVSVVASIGGPELLAYPTSTGRAAVTVEIELRDAVGARVAEGELGEVHVRSPYLMLGYWNDPHASAAVLKPDGWLAMGDLGRLIDGRLYIDSRARDLILVSAENVTPTEVEYRLEAHPDVIEAAVFAVDDPLTGDAVCAVVVTDGGGSVTTEGLATWCSESLAHYKVPTRWHVWQQPLPRNASGKLLKAEIRRLADQPVTL